MGDTGLMDIHCRACGERKRLHGEKAAGRAIQITCEACGNTWQRRPDICDACGSGNVIIVRLPLIQKARGAQQSITSYRTVRECGACGARSGSTKPPENYTREDA